jgi:hypothetical protein
MAKTLSQTKCFASEGEEVAQGNAPQRKDILWAHVGSIRRQ